MQSLSPALLSYHIGFKSKNHNHKLFKPSNGGLVCKPAKPDSHTKRKIPALRDSSYGMSLLINCDSRIIT